MPKFLVTHVPSLDRRLIKAESVPFLCSYLSQSRATDLETHPSVELRPTKVIGGWPHQHRMWQLRLKPETLPTPVHRLIDCLPDRWTTACQCVRHRFDRDLDLPTVEPRRRRRFEFHRMKFQRRFGGGDTGYIAALTSGLKPQREKGELVDFAPTILSLLGRPIPPQMRGNILFQPKRQMRQAESESDSAAGASFGPPDDRRGCQSVECQRNQVKE